jgi:hypothetical protein
MKHRSVGGVIALSFFTLGIYSLFWLSATRQEMVRLGHQIPAVKVLFTPVFTFIGIGILQIIVRLATTSGSSSAFKIVNIMSVLAGIASVVALLPVSLWWLYQYCKALEVTTSGKTSFSLSFGSLLATWVFGLTFIWPGIIQDGINKLAPPTGY